MTHLAVREGDYVETGSPIATVADLSRLWLDLEAYESQLPMLRWGQRVTFTVEAHRAKSSRGASRSSSRWSTSDADRRRAHRGGQQRPPAQAGDVRIGGVPERCARAARSSATSSPGRWVGPMHPTIVKDGPGQCDICGMDLVPAESLGVVGDPSSVEEPLVIPRSAVLFTGTRSVVYVEVPETERPTYEAARWCSGLGRATSTSCVKGSHEGERVVVNGAFRIDSAMQIAAKPSMMMPDDDARRMGA